MTIAEHLDKCIWDYALCLPCRSRDLPAGDGGGFDALPAGAREAFQGALAKSLELEEPPNDNYNCS